MLGMTVTAYIPRNAISGDPESTLSQFELPGLKTIWHSDMINFLDLGRADKLSVLALESVSKSHRSAILSQKAEAGEPPLPRWLDSHGKSSTWR
jgi:hypothetical protein